MSALASVSFMVIRQDVPIFLLLDFGYLTTFLRQGTLLMNVRAKRTNTKAPSRVIECPACMAVKIGVSWEKCEILA